jgi:mRNA degradation ribonuclease J1/J2
MKKKIYKLISFVKRKIVSSAGLVVMVVVFNATFNNISDISCQSVLLVEETRVLGESNRPATNHLQTFIT